MLNEDDLITIDGWERDHYGDYICEWVRATDADEGMEGYDGFALVIQENDDVYNVSISLVKEGSGGGLLSADYQDEVASVDEAMERGRQFVEDIEAEYNLD